MTAHPPADTARLGATVADAGTRFVVWAPSTDRVDVVVASGGTETRLALDHVADGYHTVFAPGVGHGDRYAYRLDGGPDRPDPASRHQPDGVHGRSAVVDPATFTWTDTAWRGRGLDDTVLYELHVGAFTAAGTFEAAIDQLPRLVALGVTTIEIMPVGAFPGERNWGYDGVLPWATQESYGGPEGLARFVDAAHAVGLAVILDVIANHVGPEGNHLVEFGPYFDPTSTTSWGPGMNIAGAGSDHVRRYFIEQYVGWVRDFHLDGFRFDAVHAIVDQTANPFWGEVCTAVRAAARAERRQVVLIGETSDNDPRQLAPADRGGLGFDAVWCDDVHHNLRVALTGERHGYYADYDGSAHELADTIAHRWKFRGQYSIARGRRHGRPVAEMAPHRFVAFTRNHDQVGNRPDGSRPVHLLDRPERRYLAAALLLSPYTPMLFMGEEYGEPAPFPFFVDHTDPAVLAATNEGRAAEFPAADWSVGVPEPGDPATFESAKLDPTVVERDERSASLLALYTDLIRLRGEHPAIGSPDATLQVDCDGDVVTIRRTLDDETVVITLDTATPVATLAVDGRPTFTSALVPNTTSTGAPEAGSANDGRRGA